MHGKRKHYTDILKFWRSVEAFNMPDVPTADRKKGKIYTELYKDDMLPWESDRMQNASPKKKWKHTLYFYCIKKEAVVELINRLVPDPDEEHAEPIYGNTCLASIVINQNGELIEKTYIRAAFAYGIKLLTENKSLEDLPELLKQVQVDYLKRFQVQPDGKEAQNNENDLHDQDDYEYYEENDSNEDKHEEDDQQDDNTQFEGETVPTSPVTWKELINELEDLYELAKDINSPVIPIICISQQVYEKETPDANFLNSFYINDLNALINNSDNLGKPLETYLTPEHKIGKRYDLLKKRNMLISLKPSYQSPGRWPSNPIFGLYSAQQVALNLTLDELKGGEGLIGINGPPGTGKTTLLRDIIADIVVARAKRLLKCDIKKLFKQKWNKIGDYLGYYDIEETTFGNDGILVASNNNGAVENISKELPALKSIHEKTFIEAAYFSNYAEKLLEDACWGLISAVLGNADNRFKFINNFWFNNGFGDYLKTQQENRSGDELLEAYKEVAADLESLLNEYNTFQEIAVHYHETLVSIVESKRSGSKQLNRLQQLALTLQKKYKIDVSNVINYDFMNMSMDDIHKLTPYSSIEINTLRSNIFIKSLQLHECAINYNARYFKSNLNAFINMISGKNYSLYDENITRVLWRTFFFCIPVVSTTLASVDRLFHKMTKGSIGWLLLDEAGQATPQSACGAIWRSQRCIIIGDTMQIPPVVTIPQGLVKSLQLKFNIPDDCWVPHNSSAQFLADRITAYGTDIAIESNNIWTGLPLRAHRRCDEPMFSISNSIAYNNQMVKVTANEKTYSVLGNSHWIDVKGRRIIEKNVIAEEIDKLKELLTILFSNGYEDPVYIISPFKTVANQCKKEFETKDDQIKCGTIHKFQGKETDLVFIVLGSDPGNSRARNWASSGPNILNVAITRAKKRIYVIGNKDLWSKLNYFNKLGELLVDISTPDK